MAAPSRTLLCIEDNELNMALVESFVAGLPGVTLLKASTGREGVKLARAQRPDLVLLDMKLPDIDGLQVRALNAQIADRLLRVVLITGDSFSIDVVKAMSLGAYDYWLKPMDMHKFEAGLKRALGKGSRRE